MAFNLFDFSSTLNPLGSITKTAPQIGGATGGDMMPPTTSGKPLPQTPIAKKAITPTPSFMEKAVNTLVPKASASMSEKDMQDLIDAGASDEEILQVAQEMEKQIASIQPKQETPKVEPTKPEDTTINPLSPLSIIPKIGKSIPGLGAGFVNTLVETSKFSERYLEPTNWFKSKEEVDKNVAKVEKQLSGLLQEEGAKDMPGFSTGKFAGEMLALSAMPTTAVEGAIAKLGEKYTPALVSKALSYIGTKAPIVPAITKSFSKGVVPAAGFQVASEGDVSLGTTALYAGLNPLANTAKSLPGIRNIVGNSEILNAGAIKEGQAITNSRGAIIGTKGEKETAARQLIGAGGEDYNVKTATDAANQFTKGEISAISNFSKPSEKTVSILKDKVGSLSELQSKVAGANLKPLTVDELVISSADGTVKRTPVITGIQMLLKKPGIDVEEEAMLRGLLTKLNGVPESATREAVPGIGLTNKELSDLSIFMSNKGPDFTTVNNGVISKDLNYEEARQGVKELYRKNVGDEAAVKLDEKLHSLLDLKSFVQVMDNAAKNLKAKTSNTVYDKIAKFITNIPLVGNATTAVIRAALKTTEGSGKFIGGTMTADEFSKNIAKNIKIIQKLSDGLTKDMTEQQAMKYVNKTLSDMAGYKAPIQKNVGSIKPPIIPKKPSPITNSVGQTTNAKEIKNWESKYGTK